MTPHPMRIAGELRFSEHVDEITSPYDGAIAGRVCVATAVDVEDSIVAATNAARAMRSLPTHRRVTILESIASRIHARAEELAQLMVVESGKPIRFCRGEVLRAQITFSLAAAETMTWTGAVTPIDLEPRAEGRLCLTTRVPRGPVAAISPFNFPLNLIAHKLAPAIAVGAPTVVKPPPQCPITAHLLGEICAEAGLPEGGLSVVHCAPGDAQLLVEDERMKMLSFTGSVAVGWRLKSLAGKKQICLELGGNAPCIIDAGADLDALMPKLTMGAWAHAGQVCIKVQRVLAHESSFDSFLERFVSETAKVAVGDPGDPDTVVGPLIDEAAANRVRAWIDEAVTAGARRLAGNHGEGNIIHPTILTDVPKDQKVCTEEVFGPVTVVERFVDLDEAIAAANDTRYGLQAGIFTPNLQHALHAYRELDYGGVMVNDVPTFRVDNFPYGGSKDSGFGREGVRHAMEEMTEPKVLVMC